MPPKRRNSLVVKEEPKINNHPVKIEPVPIEENENANKRVRRTRVSSGTSNATSTTSEQTAITEIHHNDLDLYLQDFFHTICTHKDALSPRLLSVVFYLLPSQKDLPEYYQAIQNPIDLKTIAKKLKSSSYKSLKELEADLLLMTENAKRYNNPRSLIAKDAVVLKRLIVETGKSLNKLLNEGKAREFEKADRQAKKKLIDQLASMTTIEFEKRLEEADRLAQSALNEDGHKNNNGEKEETEAIETKKRIKREKKSNTSTTDVEMEVDEEPEEEEEEEIDASTLKGKRNHPLIIAMWSLVDYLKELKSDSNQTLIDPFVKLPSKRTYPDYYKEIKQPISLNIIKSKLNKRQYTSIIDLNRDLTLLFTNAMTYNVEDSIIYNYAKQLMEAFMQKSAELAMTDVCDLVYSKHGEDNDIGNGLTPSKKRVSLNMEAKLSATTPPKKFNDSNVLPKLNDLREKLHYLYTYMSDFQIDGRELAHPFRVLPSKIEYPDYYNIIKKPIDMNKIMHRLNQVGKATDYMSLDEICSDFAQMFENACTYNEPESTIYKDALTLQRALFNKRDEIYKQEEENLKLDTTQNYIEKLPSNFIENSVQDIIKQLFESCMGHRDAEGRIYSDTFLQLYSMIEKDTENENFDLVTLEFMRKRVNSRFYKRMDVFQEEMFLFFNQIRMFSYIDGDYKLKKEATTDVKSQFSSKKIHRYSQLYRDTYELQRFFILKRDELCNNSELLQSPAFNYKVHGLDAHLSMTIGGTTFDEAEALLVDKRFKTLEAKLSNDSEIKQEGSVSNLKVGNFFYISKRMLLSNLEPKLSETLADVNKDESIIVCVLVSNANKTKFVVQLYLKSDQITQFSPENSLDLLRVRKFFNKEVFKSDLYALIDIKNTDVASKIPFKQCFVIGVKDYLQNTIKIINKTNSLSMPNFEDDLYICESMLSTAHNYFRKLSYKKWEPLKFLGVNEDTEDSEASGFNELKLEFNRRPEPDNKSDSLGEESYLLKLERNFLDASHVYALMDKIENKLDTYNGLPSFFKKSYYNTVQYDTPPARFKEEKDPDEISTHIIEQNQNSIEEDVELMKTAKYYEQLVLNETELFKIGDHVYINNANRLVKLKSKNPLIVRIDRLWSIDINDSNGEIVKRYYLRGPLFLRPSDIEHEPTRLFYTNEVFREQTREMTVSLDQIVSGTGSGSKKCTVLSHKKFVSSRITEIDERDVYLCEAKYSLQLKTFRKFTKGIRKFELSVKCLEDEIYFLRRELQLRKHLSPILSNLNIRYEDEDNSENEITMQTNELKAKGEISNEMRNENQNSNCASSIYNNEKNKMHDDFDDDEESNSQDYNDDSNMMDTTSGYQPSPNISKPIKPLNQNMNNSYKVQVTGKKIRQKRDRKSGYNIFSRDYRKSLRDTNSSLRFELMSKEVGYRWRELTDEQRAAYEEKARVESLKEMERVAAEREAQAAAQAQALAQEAQAQAQTQLQAQKAIVASPVMNNQLISVQQNSINTAMPQQVYIINTPIQQQQSNTQYIMLQPQQAPVIVQKQLPPQQAQHKEAYIKYIANIRKQQQMSLQPLSYQTNTMYNMVNVGSLGPLVNDCNKSLDVRVANIKENKIMPPPISWIENCPPDDVVKHLASLRYYMLNDAINVKKSESYESCFLEEDVEKENDKASSGESVYCQL